MKLLSLLFVMVMGSCQLFSDDNEGRQHGKNMVIDTAQFEKIYAQYAEPALYHRRFKHADIDSLLHVHGQKSVFAVDQIGSSFEGRSIYELTYGRGRKKVMLWSQMHGNEPTATMALFDLFNFLSGRDDEYDAIRKLLSDNLELHVIPMLNPDGAERYARHNAQHIDLNRDARVQRTIEGGLLAERARVVKPQYGFNLHDQNIYYNVPGTRNPVTISLLAPAFNEERDINKVRGGAMQLIVGMNRLLQQYIPDAVAKYDDTYSPRGFGDNFQSWGATTVLIESGGLKGDPEKQQIRKFNFIIILNALVEIAQGTYAHYPVEEYEAIPFNASQMHDVVLRNIEVERDSIRYTTDIAIRRSESTVGRDYYVRGRIADIGDLRDEFGYDEPEGTHLRMIPGRVATRELADVSTLTSEAVLAYLRNGVIAVRVAEVGAERDSSLYEWPLLLYTQQNFSPQNTINLGGTANFFLGDKEGNLLYAVVNGYLIDLSRDELPKVKNRIL